MRTIEAAIKKAPTRWHRLGLARRTSEILSRSDGLKGRLKNKIAPAKKEKLAKSWRRESIAFREFIKMFF
jgi:VIT1/CCC1 family predicted Fe2+/Mn2+ transporter